MCRMNGCTDTRINGVRWLVRFGICGLRLVWNLRAWFLRFARKKTIGQPPESGIHGTMEKRPKRHPKTANPARFSRQTGSQESPGLTRQWFTRKTSRENLCESLRIVANRCEPLRTVANRCESLRNFAFLFVSCRRIRHRELTVGLESACRPASLPTDRASSRWDYIPRVRPSGSRTAASAANATAPALETTAHRPDSGGSGTCFTQGEIEDDSDLTEASRRDRVDGGAGVGRRGA